MSPKNVPTYLFSSSVKYEPISVNIWKIVWATKLCLKCPLHLKCVQQCACIPWAILNVILSRFHLPGHVRTLVGESTCNVDKSGSESVNMAVSFSCSKSPRNFRPWYDGVFTLWSNRKHTLGLYKHLHTVYTRRIHKSCRSSVVTTPHLKVHVPVINKKLIRCYDSRSYCLQRWVYWQTSYQTGICYKVTNGW